MGINQHCTVVYCRVVKDVLADALGELDEDNSEDSDCLSDVSDVDALE